MKILYYNLQLGSHDGSNMHALGLLGSLKKKCGENNILVANDFVQTKYNENESKLKKWFGSKFRILKFVRRYVLSYKTIIGIKKKVQRAGFKPDFILARSVLYDETPFLLSRKLKCKLIIEHNTSFLYEICQLKKSDNELYVRSYESRLLKNADGIYVVSDMLKTMLLNDYPELMSQKIVVIPNGFIRDLYNLNSLDRKMIRSNIRQELSIGNKWIITFIGSLQIWHGIDKLLTVAEQMKDVPYVEFWILGDGDKRDLIKEYLSQNNNLKWFGNLPFEQMRNMLLGSDLGIMPYQEMERFYFSPLKMYDMVGANLPFLGLRTGQIESFCLDYLSEDFLFDRSTSSEIISQIYSIINDSSRYEKMKNILDINFDKQTWDNRATKLLEWMSGL